MFTKVELGLGLLEIGRPWGHVPGLPPPEIEALKLLDFAYRSGIRYFDCAASYGVAERRFGKFLKSLTLAERASVTVATKFGEHWDFSKDEPYVDHSLPALTSSLERSLELLGPIDVLQLHKPTPELLASHEVNRAWEWARRAGVTACGPSASDLDTARSACASGRFEMMQLPCNSENRRFLEVFPAAFAAGMFLAVNRPFAMGKTAAQGKEAFRFLLTQSFRGVILTGTRSPAHLAENLEAFRAAFLVL